MKTNNILFCFVFFTFIFLLFNSCNLVLLDYEEYLLHGVGLRIVYNDQFDNQSETLLTKPGMSITYSSPIGSFNTIGKFIVENINYESVEVTIQSKSIYLTVIPSTDISLAINETKSFYITTLSDITVAETYQINIKSDSMKYDVFLFNIVVE